MADGLLSLNWNNHGATFCHTLASLRGKEKYTDVTVSCGGRFYQVHKLVLSTCSEYFEKIFDNTPCKHPVIVLRDVQCEELEPLLNYMYKGVVSVAQSELSRLIKVAELLQIKGLAVPDEPPPPSKQSPNKRTSDDRLEHRSSTDGNGSPYPKRRRRRESDSYQASTSKAPSSSPSRQKKEDPLAIPWRDDQSSRRIDDRTKDSSQDHVRSPIQVNINETLIKEEIVDDDPEESVLSEGDFIGLGNAPSDGSQDPGGLLIPKFDDAADAADGSIAEPDVEPLAGPSGLQGWADGGDMTRIAASLGEGFVGTESQDMSSSVSLPSQPSGQASRQMVKGSRTNLGTDEGPKKRFHCPYCDYSSNRKDHMQRHIRVHTGEKPFACRLCPYRSSQENNLKSHEFTHKL
ncbi:hypothetical protein SK128_007757 [Halocaridina rubra]|uniref:Uncharacterized protein n=1 Tax=Halocaridina rubra TaxID=373956 RepID=A0AAN8X5U0_HALRR